MKNNKNEFDIMADDISGKTEENTKEQKTKKLTKQKPEQKEETKPEKTAINPEKEELLDGRYRTDSPTRKGRKAIGGRNPLQFEKRPGFHRRVFNDTEDRIAQAEESGYRIVTEKTKGGDDRAGADSQQATPVVRSVGAGMKGVLMEEPEEFYNEDQRKKQEQVDIGEADILRTGTTPGLMQKGQQVMGDGAYGDGLKIKR
ncbi:hypothetical protein LCGC14_0711650 [marine sediment metagenome]|uniref:Uncharacterized protein n=1 Tax=marine sediment metagenome TaxID=412755 RepID=A0A0F9QEV6_9ZZZZ